MNLKIERLADRINIDIEANCNTIEVYNDGTWNIISLTDNELKELTEFLIKAIGIK